MTEPRAFIRVDGTDRAFSPGETLSGEYRFESLSPESVKAIEVSILWCTQGKGDEDMEVHDFRRLSPDDSDWVDFEHPKYFNTTLPSSPLSYDGVILKIRWYVRVRVILKRGKDIVVETPFTLGDVPTAKSVEL